MIALSNGILFKGELGPKNNNPLASFSLIKLECLLPQA